MKTILDWALEYAARGWAVFPLHAIVDGACTCGVADCSDAGKHPRNDGGVNMATTDPVVVRRYFKGVVANIGLATGQVSGITVLDIDVKNGGIENWQELNAEKGEPPTLMVTTGSGGIHALFKYNSALNTAANVLARGIDVRNDGGYVVAPPSVHRTGRSYEWMNWSCVLLDLPKHLTRKETRGRPGKDDPRRRKHTVEEVAEMLEHIPADDRDVWRKVGIILGREFERSDPAWEAYVQWSEKWGGKKGRNHDGVMNECFYELSQQSAESSLSMGTLVGLAIDNGWAPKSGSVPVSRFIYHAPGNDYVYRPTGAFWRAESVDACCSPQNKNGKIVKASEWLKTFAACTSMTDDPIIEGEVIKGFDCREGELEPSEGAAVYNAYRKPNIEPGEASLAGPFLSHVKRVFSHDGDAEQFLNYMAHRAQQPGVKPRFALLVAGEQGVGKDTAIAMCHASIGHWNVANVEPHDLDAAFNEYAAKVLVVISEAANLHEMNKWLFNERTKNLIAGLPDNITINPKYGKKYSVRMHCGVIITTNHLLNGIFLPADDRRHDVIEAATREEMGLGDKEERARYFDELWSWYNAGGKNHIVDFLLKRDISSWSPANGQRLTDAHKKVVASGLEPDEWFEEAMCKLYNGSEWPKVIVSSELWSVVETTGQMNRNEFSKRAPHALQRAGYVRVFNPTDGRGRWKVDGKQLTVFAEQGTPNDVVINALKNKSSSANKF